MKKRFIICFVLALVLGLALVSCDDPEQPANDSTTTAAQVDEPVPDLALNGFVLIRSEDADDASIKLYADLFAEIQKLGKFDMSIKEDFLRPDTQPDPNATEILCGPTNRPESADAVAALPGYFDFSVGVVGKKLCIAANTDEGIENAIEYFKTKLEVRDGTLYYTGGSYVGKRDYPFADAEIAGTAVASYTIVYADGNERDLRSAEKLSMFFAEKTGFKPEVVSDKTAEVQNEIILGKTARSASYDSATLGSGEYVVRVAENKLVLSAGIPAGYEAIIEGLVKLMGEKKLNVGLDEKGRFEVSGLDGSRVMFVGNSFLYYGYCTTTKNKIVLGDKGYFYQVGKEMGDEIDVTSVTYGGKGFKSLYDILVDNYPNHYAKGGTLDHFYEQDYVILQQEGSNASSTLEYAEKIMSLFPPKTKFAFFIHHHNAQKNHTNVLNAAKKLRDEKGVVYIPTGHLIYDVWTGKTKVPGATLNYNKNSFVVDHSDSHHPNYLNGYLTALTCYYALSGKSITDCPHDFVRTTKEYYTKGTSNYDKILASDEDMLGLKELVEQYVWEYN